MASVRKSLFINENNQDVLEWFEGVKSPSDAICQLIRTEASKDREIELLKQIIDQQNQTIELLKSAVEGTSIRIIREDNGKDTVIDLSEEDDDDMSVGSDAANNMLSMFGA